MWRSTALSLPFLSVFSECYLDVFLKEGIGIRELLVDLERLVQADHPGQLSLQKKTKGVN
jgi:hypothetical protein